MKKRLLSLFVVLCLAGLIPLSAQQRTGNLTGIVMDDESNPLPGATVTITSPALMSPTQSVVSNQRGAFRFVNLPPGVYEIKVTLEGFKPALYKDVTINLGLTKTINPLLSPGTLSQEVVVVAATPSVNIESTKVSRNFSAEELALLPSSRDLTTVMEMSPMVVVSTDVSGDQYPDRVSAGSGSRENYYSMDGTYLTDPGNGQQMIFWNYDIIEEAQVEVAGHNAEYGNAIGSVVNIVTKSGGNDFHGQVNFLYRNKSLRSENFEGTGLDAPTNAIRNANEFSANVGGPIIRNKLWFFVSGGYGATSTETYGFPVPADRKIKNAFGKLTFHQKQHQIALVYNYSGDNTNHMFPDQFRTPESTLHSRQWTSAINLQWNWTISNNAIAQLRGVYVDRSTTYVSNGSGPMYYDLMTDMMTKSAGFGNDQTRKRKQLQGQLSYWLEGFLGGDHDIKAGFDYEYGDSGYVGDALTDAAGFDTYYTLFGDIYMAVKTDPVHYESRDYIEQLSGYVQDTWKLGRIILNLGVRVNKSKIMIPVQNKVTVPITTMNYTNFEPRLGLTYDLSTKKRQMAVKVHYGRYYANMNPINSISPNSRSYDYYFNEGGELVFGYSYSSNTYSLDPNLERPYGDVYILGFDTQVTKNISLSISGLLKNSKNFIGLIDTNRTAEWFEPTYIPNPLTGGVITYWDLKPGYPVSHLLWTNPEQAKRKYKAVSATLTKRMSNNYMFVLSYTWSRSEGNVPQSIWGYAGTASGTWNNPNTLELGYGVLDMDRTHMIKLEGIWMAPWGIAVGFNYFGQSGYAYARSFLVEDAYGMSEYQGEPLGSQRTPFLQRIDVRCEKSFTLNKIRPKVFIEVFNLMNANTATAVGATYGNPYYGRAQSIMSPRTARIGVGLSF